MIASEPFADQRRRNAGAGPSASTASRSNVAHARNVPGRRVVGDDHPQRPVAARLQRQHAVELQRRAEQRRQRQRLADHAAKRHPDNACAASTRSARSVRCTIRPRTFMPSIWKLRTKSRRCHDIAQTSTAFCACRRFSASSNTTDCGPSSTASVTSSPRCAGRQCMKIASLAAAAINRSSTR